MSVSAKTAGTVVSANSFVQFILKMNARCNLACTYCYIYSGADTGWRHRPTGPDERVLAATAHRIAEHARTHRLRNISLVLHGGEPLLSGPAALADAVERVRRAVPADCVVHASVQTNATLLTDDGIRLLAAHGIRIGVSLDGGSAHHNRERVDHAGRPSWQAAERGLRLLAEKRHSSSYAGVLCVVDLRSDPAEVYRSLLSFHPPAMDFLLPHGNWTTPPPGLPAPDTPYGDWLCAVFDLWWAADRRRTRIRLFEECIALLVGAPAATESMGLQPFTAVVVETDGSIEQVDSLKSAYEGAAGTDLDVFRNTFDDALHHPGILARQAGLAALADECQRCPLVKVCGGGQYTHRYRAGSGFRNPTIYCHDQQRLIRHIAGRLTEAAAQ